MAFKLKHHNLSPLFQVPFKRLSISASKRSNCHENDRKTRIHRVNPEQNRPLQGSQPHFAPLPFGTFWTGHGTIASSSQRRGEASIHQICRRGSSTCSLEISRTSGPESCSSRSVSVSHLAPRTTRWAPQPAWVRGTSPSGSASVWRCWALWSPSVH